MSDSPRRSTGTALACALLCASLLGHTRNPLAAEPIADTQLMAPDRALHDTATAYVCVDRVCSYPASDSATLAQQLRVAEALPMPTPLTAEVAD